MNDNKNFYDNNEKGNENSMAPEEKVNFQKNGEYRYIPTANKKEVIYSDNLNDGNSTASTGQAAEQKNQDVNVSEAAIREEDNTLNLQQQSADAYSNEQQAQEAAKHSQPEEKEAFFQETVKKEKKEQAWPFKKLIAACLIVCLAGGSIGAGYSITQNIFIPREEAASSIAAQGDTPDNTLPNENEAPEIVKRAEDKDTSSSIGVKTSNQSTDGNTAISIIKEVAPSVVSITTKATGTANYYFNGFQIPYESTGAGSGVIFYKDSENVYIATNDHVVDGATEIGVSFSGAEEDINAKIVGLESTSDLAVVSVKLGDLRAAGVNDITVATFGDSDKLEVGESVIAIGNALGEGKTSTGGMISAMGKEINIDGKKLEVIQTDAAINPGNSGGALVNYNGEVIGINTAKAYEEAVEGMGYAIPSNTVIPIIEKLLTEGTAEKPYLGIVGQSITEQVAQLYGGLPIGVLVQNVVEGGSADQAGIQATDIITTFAGEKVMSMDGLMELLAKQKVGSSVEVGIIRNGNTPMTLTVVIQDANKQ